MIESQDLASTGQSTFISHLPAETLCEIFSYLLKPQLAQAAEFFEENHPLNHDDYDWGVSHVCRRWRSTAIACPILWTVISLPLFGPSQTEVWLMRSKDAHLQLDLNLKGHPDDPEASPVVKATTLVFHHIHRVRDINLVLTPEWMAVCRDILAPQLRRFNIRYDTGPGGSVDPRDTSASVPFLRLPSRGEMTSDGRYQLTQLPHPHHRSGVQQLEDLLIMNCMLLHPVLFPNTLRHLSLYLDSHHPRLSYTALIAILEPLKALEKLQFTDGDHYPPLDECGLNCPTCVPIISLPNLVSVRLEIGGLDYNLLVSHLDIPILRCRGGANAFSLVRENSTPRPRALRFEPISDGTTVILHIIEQGNPSGPSFELTTGDVQVATLRKRLGHLIQSIAPEDIVEVEFQACYDDLSDDHVDIYLGLWAELLFMMPNTRVFNIVCSGGGGMRARFRICFTALESRYRGYGMATGTFTFCCLDLSEINITVVDCQDEDLDDLVGIFDDLIKCLACRKRHGVPVGRVTYCGRTDAFFPRHQFALLSLVGFWSVRNDQGGQGQLE